MSAVPATPAPMTTMKRLLLPLSLLALMSACRGVSNAAVDEPHRKGLFARVAALAGTWQSSDSSGATSTREFALTSAGSVVREVMFPGTPHEMTNMYSLDGNDLVMTHYCAGGNQPSMRASDMQGDALPFRFESVRDLNDPDQTYMGEMTLVFKDDGSVEQHWAGLTRGRADPEHAMVFVLTRR